jgi:hypothetical protein
MSAPCFWRGYWPLLLSLCAAQIAQQTDVAILGRLGGGAQSAYVLLMRLAVPDLVLMMAMGAVVSTSVAGARRGGDCARTVGRALGLSIVVGAGCGALGFAIYPRLAAAIAGEGEIAALIASAIQWHALTAPLRFLANSAAFALHALDEGPQLVRWKLTEAGVKALANIVMIFLFGLGFLGCFVAGFFVVLLSVAWCGRRLAARGVDYLCFPHPAWAAPLLRDAAWESQRMISGQLAVLASLALFAAPWLGRASPERFSAYATGQTLMLFAFAPMIALMRFLAFRLANATDVDAEAARRALWRRGAPAAALMAAGLYVGADALGALYGQQGVWWSTLIHALALSLPLRYATNVLRAALQAQGSFNIVAAQDSAAHWLGAAPLVAIGLAADSPAIAYASLIAPEAICAAAFWRRLHPPRRRLAPHTSP